MMELIDTRPPVRVAPEEYARLLGYPRGHVLDGRAADLADQTRAWYDAHGRPWLYARQAAHLDVRSSSVLIDGVPFAAGRLRATIERAAGHAVVLVAVGAGAELEADAARRWREEKPDEYFFLEAYGSGVVEHLLGAARARLSAWARAHGLTLLPHDSPGYPGWDVAEQPRLLDLVKRTAAGPFPAAIEALESGALRPKKSQLAVFGLTRHADRRAAVADELPCRACALTPCAYRRGPARDATARAPRDASRAAAARSGDRDDSLDGEAS